MKRSEFDHRIAELDIRLPEPKAALANYVPTVLAGDLLYVSGQVAFKDGEVFGCGQVGTEVNVEIAKEAARLCGLAILSHIRSQLTETVAFVQVCSVTGYVHAASYFGGHADVINEASKILVQALGEKGRHSRAAVGVSSLPFRCPVEVSAIVQLGRADGGERKERPGITN